MFADVQTYYKNDILLKYCINLYNNLYFTRKHLKRKVTTFLFVAAALLEFLLPQYCISHRTNVTVIIQNPSATVTLLNEETLHKLPNTHCQPSTHRS